MIVSIAVASLFSLSRNHRSEEVSYCFLSLSIYKFLKICKLMMSGHRKSQSKNGYYMTGGVNVSGIGDIELSRIKQQEQRNSYNDGSFDGDEYDDNDDYDEIYFEEEKLLENVVLMERTNIRDYDNNYDKGKTCIIEMKWTRLISFVLLLIVSFLGLYLWTQNNNNQNNNHVSINDDIKDDPFYINAEQNANDDFFITTTSGVGKNDANNNKDNNPLYSKTLISSNFADVTEPYNIKGGDLLIYWHIPKSGGTAVEDILGNCFGLAEASQQGINGHESDKDLKLLKDVDGITYANVDVSTPDGIQHAQSLGLIDDTIIVDVAFTSYINEIAEIMKPLSDHRGRCFTIIRHPVKRAVSMFYYLQIASWETTYHPRWQNMTIEEYAQSEFVENDWMTRMLIQRINGGGPVTPDEFELAKDILRNKCLIGLLDDLENSLIRFGSYFHWNRDQNINKVQLKGSHNYTKRDQLLCQKNVLKRGGDNAHPHPHYSEDSDVWNQLSKHNYYDLQLYEYALQLYDEQEKLIQ